MSGVWFYLFIIIAGVLQAAGAVMNAQLRAYLVNPWLASFVSFVLIAFFFASMFAIIASGGKLECDAVVGSLGRPGGRGRCFCGADFDRQARRCNRQWPYHQCQYHNVDCDRSIRIINTPVHEANIWRIIGGALMVGGITLISLF